MRRRNLNKVSALTICKWLKRKKKRQALARKRNVPYIRDFVDYQSIPIVKKTHAL